MKFYEVNVEADNLQGSWQGSGYWFVKPGRDQFARFLESVRQAVLIGVQDLNLFHDAGLSVLISVIDVPLESVARYQREAYHHDQLDETPTLCWSFGSARISLNGGPQHG